MYAFINLKNIRKSEYILISNSISRVKNPHMLKHTKRNVHNTSIIL